MSHVTKHGEGGFSAERIRTSNSFPPSRSYLLRLIDYPKTAPPSGGQNIHHLRLGGTFHIQMILVKSLKAIRVGDLSVPASAINRLAERNYEDFSSYSRAK